VSERDSSPLRELRRDVWPVPDAAQEAERRERIAARVVELSRQLPEARNARRPALGLLLAALVGVGALVLVWQRSAFFGAAEAHNGGVRLLEGHASLSHDGALLPLETGRIDASDEPLLVTGAEERAELRLGSETSVRIAPKSKLGLKRERTATGFEERVRLRSGSVALRVPKLGARGKVLVETGDALVEVHGTEFAVRVIERPALPALTAVDVTEGRVQVHSKNGESRMLGAGDHWRSEELGAAPEPDQANKADQNALSPQPAVALRPEEEAAEKAEEKATEKLAEKKPAKARAKRPSAPSELAAQNRLLEAAELAQQNGMPELALERLETLIRRYPDSELGHNAEVERFRLLGRIGRNTEARTAAQRYLVRHPDGFAEQEARRVVLRGDAP
jgi:hypothetical protein